MTLTENESIFCQAIAMTSLITALSKDFLYSQYYKNLHFSSNDANIKNVLDASGIGNPATLQIFLYTLLVMPKEILEKSDKSSVDQIKLKINELVPDLIRSAGLSKEIITTYPKESVSNLNSIDFYRHIRNAVSHSKCFYKVVNNERHVTFIDNSPKKESCEFTLKTEDVGKILNMLQEQLMIFLNTKWDNR